LAQHIETAPVEEKEVVDLTEPTLPAKPVAAHAQRGQTQFSKMGLVTFFILIGLALLLFTGQIATGLVQANAAVASTPLASATPVSQKATPASKEATATATQEASVPFFLPPNNSVPPNLQLAAGHYVLYQGMTHLFLVSTTDDVSQAIYTPGYTYNQAVRPILLADGHLLYSGLQGLWITDVFDPHPEQLVQFPADTTLTSLSLSQDGQTLAWSTEPTDGNGQTDIYAGPLGKPQLVFQQSSLNCPCFRIFSFMNGSGSNADTTLLLTDDRGSNEAVMYGLWSLDLSSSTATPQLIMAEDPQQGPLTLAPYSNRLLYSTYEGAVPVPTDNSVPADVAALSYADSLSITTLSGSPLAQNTAQVILPEQHDLANTAQYHWVTTPTFSPDGGTLAYVEFSSDTQAPYDRYSAVYTVQVSGSGNQVQASKPVLLAISTAHLLELGPWLNSHVITLYGDGSIYALDVQSGALTTLATPGGYQRVLGVIGTGQE
jgi:hypothetical protein